MTMAWKTLLTTIGGASTLALSTPSAHPALIWNASPSVPVGLYRVTEDRAPKLMDLVVVRPPDDLVSFLAEGHYLPRGVPLLKHVAALGGQRVCRIGFTISVDSVPLGDALERDHLGRPLPSWSGCIVLTDDQVFLMNPDRPGSLDGRYFGPLDRSTIVGRAEPIWTGKED